MFSPSFQFSLNPSLIHCNSQSGHQEEIFDMNSLGEVAPIFVLLYLAAVSAAAVQELLCNSEAVPGMKTLAQV